MTSAHRDQQPSSLLPLTVAERGLYTPCTRLLVRPLSGDGKGLSLDELRVCGRASAEDVCPYVHEYGDAAELVTSELVTNALTHGARGDEPVYVEFPSSPWSWKIRVLDPSPEPPREVVAYDDDTSGRGLFLVHFFAGQYDGHLDVEITGAGKAVTCTLPIPAPNRVADEVSA
ncbi:ATP-binding protein [Streptomyces rimosus]|uniref:ATP-binding protein n=1 Tax=Streptomyces rimosus TaxID=1927 RepID=UPI00067C64AD|nr:ATP-binding protein [Streptomyces rimosus]